MTRLHSPSSSNPDTLFFMNSTGMFWIEPEQNTQNTSIKLGLMDRDIDPGLVMFFHPALVGSTSFTGPDIAVSTGNTPTGSTTFTSASGLYYQGFLFSNLETNGDNWLEIAGSTAGGSAINSGALIAAFGVDAAIDIVLQPKGTTGGVIDFNQISAGLGGGAAATLGTIGGAGPTAAGQVTWLPIRVAGSTNLRFIPVWQ